MMIDADLLQVVIDEPHRGFIIGRMHKVAIAGFQLQGHGACIFHLVVIDYGYAVGGRAVRGGDGHPLRAQICHKLAHMGRQQPDGEILHRHWRCRHREHGMLDGVSSVALGQLGLVSRHTHFWPVVVIDGHGGHVARRRGHLVACWVGKHPEGHSAVRFIVIVIGNGNTVLDAIGASGNGHLGGTQVARRHEVICLAHHHHDQGIFNHLSHGRHCEHSIAGWVAWVAFGHF